MNALLSLLTAYLMGVLLWAFFEGWSERAGTRDRSIEAYTMLPLFKDCFSWPFWLFGVLIAKFYQLGRRSGR